MGLKARSNFLQANRISPEHRSAGGSRPAIAVEPDDVDVGGALCDALFKDPRALIDHRIKQPLQDLLILDLAWPIAPPLGEPGDDRFDFRGRSCDSLCVVVVVSLRRFLATPIALAGQIANTLPLRGLAAPTEVEAGEIAHLKRPHPKPEARQHAIDVPGFCALKDQPLRLRLTLPK